MDNLDMENFNELVEIRQYFLLSKICHTVLSLAGIDSMPPLLIMPRPSILLKASVIIVIIVIINGLQGIACRTYICTMHQLMLLCTLTASSNQQWTKYCSNHYLKLGNG